MNYADGARYNGGWVAGLFEGKGEYIWAVENSK
jgi:MORN repeat